jgi:3'-phosphoadenosine 5'-phosphosulfate (PAPS) 3'-phosphatase
VDRAAEAWVVEYLSSIFPQDAILAEEAYDAKKPVWVAPDAFWTIDALDGTASYVDGFDGFCIQVAFIVAGDPVLGVVHQPVGATTYWAIRGEGAYRQSPGGGAQRLELKPFLQWPEQPVFVDSTLPGGVVGALYGSRNGAFLECGSTGVKICRVAEGSAHLLIKSNQYKIWDLAPGDVILSEAGGRLALWDGSPVNYGSVYAPNMLSAPAGLAALATDELRQLKKAS